MQRLISMVGGWFGPSGELGGGAALRPPIVPGVSLVAELEDRFGAPGMVWRNADGTLTFEYSDACNDALCYMVHAGADDVVLGMELAVSDVRFARVRAGMSGAEVRRLMGRPASSHYQPGAQQTVWRWYVGHRNNGKPECTFGVWFDQDGEVIHTRRVVE